MGGDEFIILLNNIDVAGDAETVAGKTLTSLAEPISLESQSVNIGGSIGISIFPDHAEDTEKLIYYADSAMYYIKKTGKNGYAFHK